MKALTGGEGLLVPVPEGPVSTGVLTPPGSVAWRDRERSGQPTAGRARAGGRCGEGGVQGPGLLNSSSHLWRKGKTRRR